MNPNVDFLRDAYSFLENRFCKFIYIKGLGKRIIGGGYEIDIFECKDLLIKEFGQKAINYFERIKECY